MDDSEFPFILLLFADITYCRDLNHAIAAPRHLTTKSPLPTALLAIESSLITNSAVNFKISLLVKSIDTAFTVGDS